MLTKEECLKAHEELSKMLIETDYLDGRAVCTYPIMEDELGLFYKLIEEHFELVELLKPHGYGMLSAQEFEEDRFFPVTKALTC